MGLVRLVALCGVGGLVTGAADGSAILQSPEGVAEDESDRLLVVDSGMRFLARVDPVTGEIVVVSDDNTGTGPPFGAPVDVAVEPGGSAIVVDSELAAVLRVDPSTGDRSIISDAQTGSGLRLREPVSVAVAADGQFLVVDSRRAAVLRVDPLSGERAVVSGAGVGGGPLLERPQGIDLEVSGALLVGDRAAGEPAASLLRIDPVTGNRTTVSGTSRGDGQLPGVIVDLTTMADGRIVLVDNGNRKQLIVVDPLMGDRERLSGVGVGGGPQFEDPRGIVATETGLMVAEAGLDAVVRVDPLDGSRYVLGAGFTGGVLSVVPSRVICRNETTGQQVLVQTSEVTWDCDELGLVSSPGDVVFTGAWGEVDQPGGGSQFDHPQGVAVESGGGILVADDLEDAIFRVDPLTGDRTVLSSDDVGQGPLFDDPRGVAVEADGSVVVMDEGSDQLFRLDPVSGDRTIVSDDDRGDGKPFFAPFGIEVAEDGSLLVVDNTIPGVFRVDPVTGDRTIVSGGEVGGGPEFQDPWDLAIEPDGNLLVTDWIKTALLRVDVATGDRTIVNDIFAQPRGIAIDANDQALVVEYALDAVWRVDPVTGDLTVVSGETRGIGPEFFDPSWIAVEADGQILVTDVTSLFRVDPVTGDRVVLSGPPTNNVGGSIGGVEFPAEVACRNLTTGQVVKDGVDVGTSWDCEDRGLDVEDGDLVFTGARAIR